MGRMAAETKRAQKSGQYEDSFARWNCPHLGELRNALLMICRPGLFIYGPALLDSAHRRYSSMVS